MTSALGGEFCAAKPVLLININIAMVLVIVRTISPS
jgi:hypothetical protein